MERNLAKFPNRTQRTSARLCFPYASALARCGKKIKNGSYEDFRYLPGYALQLKCSAQKCSPYLSVQQPFGRRGGRPKMSASNHIKNIPVILFCTALLFSLALRAQDKSPDSKGKADSSSNSVHLTIVVTTAEDKKPVDSASVYVKYVQGRLLGKDKKIEMNLKTNMSGIVHVPEIPRGRFLVQVIAPGWKTFGEYYEVDQAEQTINIELARPPKWY